MKKHYIAASIKENEKNYAFVLPVSENVNLLSALNKKSIYTAHLCSTKKQAAELVTYWNNAYKQNGTFLFD